MVTRNVCLKCGASLGDGARLSFCSKCLFLAAGGALLDPSPDSIGPDEEGGPVEFEHSSWSAIRVELPAWFGDYELLEEIGRGGMGVVYRARQRSLDRVVAIKMMSFGPHSSPDLIKRFQAEAVAAASLHHPNIVAIHEVGVRGGQHFFVMDHIDGQNLAKLLGNFPLAGGRAAGYLKTVAEAIHYAHERGILHRDLKPSNVLIDLNDQPHVVDFGLARRLEGDSELTLTGQVLGSPCYLSPEQATAGRIRVSRRTDVYALGATLYQLLTGRPPFQAESLAQTLDLVLHTEPVSPRLLNPGILSRRSASGNSGRRRDQDLGRGHLAGVDRDVPPGREHAGCVLQCGRLATHSADLARRRAVMAGASVRRNRTTRESASPAQIVGPLPTKSPE